MAIMTNSTLNHTGLGTFQTTKLTPVSSLKPVDKTNYSADEMLQVNTRLQSTLDLEELIDIFANQVRSHVSFDSLRYQNEPQVKKIKIGRDFPHCCRFSLLSHEGKLGEITFTRRKPFSPQESSNLESLLRNLVYPLRNALLYRHALLAAHKDPLTGVKNRAAMDEALRRELGRAKRYQNPLSLIVLDIDRFKVINDTHGHSIGDCLLKQLAECTSLSIRRSDMLFRYGGEEFVILLNNTAINGACRLAERVRRRIERLDDICGRGISMTISAGVATMTESDDENSLFEKADQALYQAKNSGRNCIAVAD